MTLPIISSSERLREKRGIKGVIFGKSGIGKTSLLWTLDARRTLFFDLEAGDLAVQGWEGDTIRPKTWQECRDLAVFIGGGNLSLLPHQPFSQAHFGSVCKQYGNPRILDKYDIIFIDSLTVAGRLCLQWCRSQPQAFSDRAGKEDTRAIYGLHAQEMIAWLTHLQHIRSKNIWLIGTLDEKLDEFNRKVFSPQIEGNKASNELPGIFDQIITMAEVPLSEGKTTRAFINHTMNEFGFPAKDRSGRLGMLEEPHLGKLMQKIQGPIKPASQRLIYEDPSQLALKSQTEGEKL